MHPALREMTDRDGYWGAKIVASFSDAQVEAAVEAAQFEEPRAGEFLVRNLIVRRDKIARHWFGRVAPLDFFSVQDGAVRFHDLAVELGLEGARGHDVAVAGARAPGHRHVHLDSTVLPLLEIGDGASRLSLEISVARNGAKPARVELSRTGSEWEITRVRHG